MKKILEWSSDYEVGHPEVDAQHQWLFQISHEIVGADLEKAKKVIKDLQSYTRIHFRKEEELMMKIEFPQLQEHHRIHSEFSKRIHHLGMIEDFSESALENLVKVLMKWIQEHILKEDMKIQKFMNENNISLGADGKPVFNNRFGWSSDYELGHEEIDHQHRWLFKIANDIHGADENKVQEKIMELYKYTRVHFEQEEALMKEKGYPRLLEHQEFHELLISNLNDLSGAEDESYEGIENLVGFMMKWIREHILTEDLKFFNYLKEGELPS